MSPQKNLYKNIFLDRFPCQLWLWRNFLICSPEIAMKLCKYRRKSLTLLLPISFEKVLRLIFLFRGKKRGICTKKNSLHKSCKKPFFLVIYTRAYMYNHFDVYMSSLDQRIQLICSIKASHIYIHTWKWARSAEKMSVWNANKKKEKWKKRK